ncbi:MAG TPA: nucleotidyltransferase domain-containing protein [Solirubrobacteraceae bacterium]|nr:nucleotidyltransferase domain-containing protein [Solirubrobacteraceae bacterium]
MLAGTTMALTGRQVALLTGRKSHSGVLAVLNRLTEHGLVSRVELNRAYLFALNRDHLAAPAVEILAGMRKALFDELRDVIDDWPITPVHVSLFGSAARGDGDTRSDFDLLVVRPDSVDQDEPAWRSQIDELVDLIRRRTGNHASVIERDDSGMERLRAAEPPILSELLADALVLNGSRSQLADMLEAA